MKLEEKDKEILDQLYHGNHLEPDELKRAEYILKSMLVSLESRTELKHEKLMKWIEQELKDAKLEHIESMGNLSIVDGIEYNEEKLRDISSDDFNTGYDLGFYDAIKNIKRYIEKC
jgi:hypothetical protein